jgi:hypothetical protein
MALRDSDFSSVDEGHTGSLQFVRCDICAGRTGLHPADTEALLRALDRLKAAGNSLFVVEQNSMSSDTLTGSSTSVPTPASKAARCFIAGPSRG